VSRENLELARWFIELGRKGDWSRLALLAEDVLYRPIAEITETGEYHGREGFRRYMEGFLEDGWAKDLSFEGTSFRAYGDKIIVRIQLSGHGRASGLDFGARVFQVLTFRNGQIARIEDFIDRSDALRAAGQ
jgi:ketosteroid isomerase-like protein